MKDKKLILTTGMPGAGKSLVSKAAKMLGIPVLVMGDVVREEAKKRGLEPTPQNLGLTAKLLRKEHGDDIIAKKTLEKVVLQDSKVVLVDGIRSLPELDFFRRKVKNLILIAVHASPKTRFKRLLKRGRNDDPKTWEEFCERDRRELEFGIGGVIALADIMLVNEEIDKNEMFRKAYEVLEKVAEDESDS
ncbi:MAG TPA: flagellar hook-basal body complex protein FliE [Thermoproteales archaeon]|nr:flagellar hook-basal body complex protein FliE [Thermoproteales archaeon]